MHHSPTDIICIIELRLNKHVVLTSIFRLVQSEYGMVVTEQLIYIQHEQLIKSLLDDTKIFLMVPLLIV